MDATRDVKVGQNAWAKYVDSLRTRSGWNPTRLARETGIHRATIYRWLSGESTNVTVANVRAIAAAVGDDADIAIRAAGEFLVDDDLTVIADPDLRLYAEIMANPDVSDEQKRIMREQIRLWAAQVDERRAERLRAS
ncbi:MAG TPA: helix-turn-helix transcriptional regulator [Rugosimonospora sp.]|nr:helix-turn-helix transcriptional regulator [Rugosimonospora sp.]